MNLPAQPPIIQHAPGPLGWPGSARDRAVSALEEALVAEKALRLQAGSQSRAYVHPERATRGVLVMYHGFTASPWQFEPLARQAYAAGYDVYVPRLPGHGLVTPTGVEDASGLVKAREWRAYERFGNQTFALASGLGGPVSVLGLSVGGNVALAVAEQHPEVLRVVAYAPFLLPKDRRVKTAFAIARVADALTHGVLGSLLDSYRFSWGEQTRLDTASGKRPGHSFFFGGNAYAASELGWQVIDRAPTLSGRLQVFATAADDAADEGAMRELFARAGTHNGWFRYRSAEGVPHPMVHPQEDQGRGQTPELYRKTLAFLAHGELQQQDGEADLAPGRLN